MSELQLPDVAVKNQSMKRHLYPAIKWAARLSLLAAFAVISIIIPVLREHLDFSDQWKQPGVCWWDLQGLVFYNPLTEPVIAIGWVAVFFWLAHLVWKSLKNSAGSPRKTVRNIVGKEQ
jgi:hypothetical protein